VINFFEFVAEQVRELLAGLGYRSLDEVVGRCDLLDPVRAITHWKASGLDLAPILHRPGLPEGTALRRTKAQDHGLDRALDHRLIEAAGPALRDGTTVRAEFAVRNVNRTVGTMLGQEVTRAAGPDGLPDGTIQVTLTGSAGQSFGAFLPRGVTLRLIGDANDYVGKGLSGGRIVVRPPEEAPFVAADQVVAGNVIGYGATSGQLNLRGVVGERFCVRNSGAVAVVEGVGDHALEYMTGGTAVVLGGTGRNLGAGMSGGAGYVLDLDRLRVNRQALQGDLLLHPVEPGGTDAALLLELVTEHADLTGSTVARDLLASGADWPVRFTRITPRHYASVTRIREQAQARGEDPNGPHAWQQIVEESRG
jgi:glutamate synthase (NADPH/NADH) large chain